MSDDSTVKKERNGWRDEAISLRHRLWGWDCPCVDIDFLLIEFDKSLPVALVEYKITPDDWKEFEASLLVMEKTLDVYFDNPELHDVLFRHNPYTFRQ